LEFKKNYNELEFSHLEALDCSRDASVGANDFVEHKRAQRLGRHTLSVAKILSHPMFHGEMDGLDRGSGKGNEEMIEGNEGEVTIKNNKNKFHRVLGAFFFISFGVWLTSISSNNS
jgi:hypothetical protein